MFSEKIKLEKCRYTEARARMVFAAALPALPLTSLQPTLVNIIS